MTFTCGNCNHEQKIANFYIGFDISKTNHIGGASCSNCGFNGESRMSPQAWRLLETSQRLENEGTPLVDLKPRTQFIKRIEDLVKQVGNTISAKLEAALKN